MRRLPLSRYVLLLLAATAAVWLACQLPADFDFAAWRPAGFFS